MENNMYTSASSYVYSPYIPVLITSTSAMTVDNRMTFKYKNKTFAIWYENEKLAKKLVKATMKDWVLNIASDDEGIANLCRYLCDVTYKESRSWNDEYLAPNRNIIMYPKNLWNFFTTGTWGTSV